MDLDDRSWQVGVIQASVPDGAFKPLQDRAPPAGKTPGVRSVAYVDLGNDGSCLAWIVDVWERLERTRGLVETWLPALPDEELGRVERYLGELWSVRKVLRRLAYHEWFHLRVIQRIRSRWERER